VYCLCVNVYCHRLTTQLQLINISYHISYRIIISYLIVSYIISYHISYRIIFRFKSRNVIKRNAHNILDSPDNCVVKRRYFFCSANDGRGSTFSFVYSCADCKIIWLMDAVHRGLTGLQTVCTPRLVHPYHHNNIDPILYCVLHFCACH
jgi:hypothetical protein